MKYTQILTCIIIAVTCGTVNANTGNTVSHTLPALRTTTPDPKVIYCRKCVNAQSLSDCTTHVICDRSIEECYMEQTLTEAAQVVYNSGCRAKDVCRYSGGSSSIGTGLGRKRSLVLCSRCCDNEDRCNKRLCNIPEGNVPGVTTCYSCDHITSEQSEVRDPKDCLHMTTCSSNEVCMSSTNVQGGRSTYFSGCYSKMVCKLLMTRAFEDLKVCYGRNLSDPNLPSDIRNQCGNIDHTSSGIGKRATAVCHACCGESGCNYGSCKDLREQMFTYYINNLLDMDTLKLKTNG